MLQRVSFTHRITFRHFVLITHSCQGILPGQGQERKRPKTAIAATVGTNETTAASCLTFKFSSLGHDDEGR